MDKDSKDSIATWLDEHFPSQKLWERKGVFNTIAGFLTDFSASREQAIAKPLRALTEFIATHPMRVLCDDYEELIALAAKGRAALSQTREKKP